MAARISPEDQASWAMVVRPIGVGIHQAFIIKVVVDEVGGTQTLLIKFVISRTIMQPIAPECYDDSSSQHVNLANAFNSGCSLGPSTPSDWYLDTGAMTHMINTATNLDSSSPYNGYDKIIVGNGAKLSISYTGSYTLSHNLSLLDVLVVPHIMKNLLSISKFTSDVPINVLFIADSFEI